MAHIDNDVLISYGASTQRVKKGEIIFHEGSNPHYFYQLIEGEVKMVSLNRQGKELILGIRSKGDSFGEPPLFINKTYPSTAVTLKDSIVIKISKDKLDILLRDNPTIALNILVRFAEKIYQKTITSQILAASDPEEKILSFLDRIKKIEGANNPIKIPYTRQQIANSTGLCVETVIRTLIKLSDEKMVEIKNHKVYY